MQLPVQIIITHKVESKVTGAKSVTEYHLSADSTAHASSLLAGCTNIRNITLRADKIVTDGVVVQDRYASGVAPVNAVVVPPAGK